MVNQGEVWYIRGRCGTSGGGVVHQGEVWYIRGRCGESGGGVVSQGRCGESGEVW